MAVLSATALSLRQGGAAETAAGAARPAAQSEPRTKETAGRDAAAAAKDASEGKPAATSNEWAQQSVQLDDIETLLKLLPLEQRDAVLADQAAFQNLVNLEVQNRSLLTAARANKLENDPLVQTLMRRGANRVLAETYLNQVIRTNLPAGFPTEEQTKSYFDQNKSKFEAPERVHLWQIFFPADKDAKATEVAEVRKKAQALAKSLKQGKQDFAQAASDNSRHQASRLNGGYMGLIKMSDLLPEVRDAIKSMKEDAVSDPIRTDDGFHIVKRGALLPPQPLVYDDIKLQIKQLLLRDAVNRIREGALKKIQDTYPVKVGTDNLEDWRQKLRGTDAGAKNNPESAAAAKTPPTSSGNKPADTQ